MKSAHNFDDLNKLIQDTKNIDFRENIKIISLRQFLEFLGLEENKNSLSEDETQILSDFTLHAFLANEALVSDKKLNKLIELEKNYSKFLERGKKKGTKTKRKY